MPSPTVTDRPATFGEVMASREFRAVFTASALSWLGDYTARAAVAALVYQRTDSIAYSSATFAISFLPWFGFGSVLTAIVDRYPYRRAMIICDLVRLGTMGMIAIPGMPIGGMLALLLITAFLNPPFDAARSALLPQVLEGDRYVVGLSLQRTTNQLTIVLGYVCGASLAAYSATGAIAFNASTFGLSAAMVWLGVRSRPSTMTPHQRTGLLRETGDGFALVFRSPLLRAIAILMFISVFFSILPEGLAAGWAATLTGSASDRGWYQGVIMMANPAGFVVGGLLIGRFVAPATRLVLIKPFAVLTPVSLLPSLFNPTVQVVAAMSAATGFFVAGLLPATNALFVQALPTAFRARAFGVMQSGMMISQGSAVFIAGALADVFPLPTVVGVWSALGVLVMLVVASTWPSREMVSSTLNAVREANGDEQ